MEPKPYYTKQLAALYGVNVKTMLKWLQPIIKQHNITRVGHLWNTQQVRIFFEHLDPPSEIKRTQLS